MATPAPIADNIALIQKAKAKEKCLSSGILSGLNSSPIILAKTAIEIKMKNAVNKNIYRIYFFSLVSQSVKEFDQSNYTCKIFKYNKKNKRPIYHIAYLSNNSNYNVFF